MVATPLFTCQGDGFTVIVLELVFHVLKVFFFSVGAVFIPRFMKTVKPMILASSEKDSPSKGHNVLSLELGISNVYSPDS